MEGSRNTTIDCHLHMNNGLSRDQSERFVDTAAKSAIPSQGPISVLSRGLQDLEMRLSNSRPFWLSMDAIRDRRNRVSAISPLFLFPLSFSYIGIDMTLLTPIDVVVLTSSAGIYPIRIHCHEVGEDEGGNLITDLLRQLGRW